MTSHTHLNKLGLAAFALCTVIATGFAVWRALHGEASWLVDGSILAAFAVATVMLARVE